MDGLINDLSLQLLGAVQGSVPPENFRQWLMRSMLDFESSDDDELIELAFSLELLGFEFQRGDRSPESYLAAIVDEVRGSSLADRLLPGVDVTNYYLDDPNLVSDLPSATEAPSGMVNDHHVRVFLVGLSVFSPKETALLTFANHP